MIQVGYGRTGYSKRDNDLKIKVSIIWKWTFLIDTSAKNQKKREKERANEKHNGP